jgi:hypothetical protein
MSILFNENFCHSIKSSKNLVQCNNKPKCNEVFCGKHLNKKKIILFNQVDLNSHQIINDVDNSSCGEYKLVDKDTSKNIYSKEVLFDRITNNIYLSVYSIRASIKDLKLNKFIDTKQSKSFLINDLKKFISRERYFLANKGSIILIQSIMRRWSILRRKQCVNDTDILTFTDKYDIDRTYLYIFNDVVTKKKYAFDIRTLMKILSSGNQTCPYTFRAYTDNEKKEIIEYCSKLMVEGIKFEIEKPKLSVEEEIEMKMKDVFYKINMLDNYTSHTWFKNLAHDQLIDLYTKIEDIWNYRSNMTFDSKKKIVKDGIVFAISSNIIRSYTSKIKLQNILLDEFNRMITEGIDINEKKLGAILILTGMVEVSFEAAEALPHLIQI